MVVHADNYKNLYFLEAEDKLSALTAALLGLEKEPSGVVFAQDAMRAAHTLKSSSASMGYSQISSLAHVMEDFFEEARSQKKELSSDTVQLLLESVDFIVEAINLVKNGGDESDSSNLIRRLNIAKDEKDASAKVKIQNNNKSEVLSHPSESSIEVRNNKPEVIEPITSIKVGVEVLDSLMTLTEELLVEKMRLEQIVKSSQESLQNIPADLVGTVKNISRLTSDLQYTVTQAHMVPLGQLFERFPRVVRDLAKQQGKDIEFTVGGQDIELDRVVIDRLGEPLIHLLRNAVDHGISEKGIVKLSAERARDKVHITVENSGNAVDWKMIIEAAVSHRIINAKRGKELIDMLGRTDYRQNQKNSDTRPPVPNPEIEALLFNGRLSTSDKITEVSGRGVGLAIVKTAVASLGGKVFIESPLREGYNNTSGPSPRGGARFIIELPLTIAIVQALLVRVSDNVFALPFSQVDRLVRVPFSHIKKAFDQEVAVVDGEDIPIIRLKHYFGIGEARHLFLSEEEMKETRRELKAELLVVTRRDKDENARSGQVGLIVDEVFSEQDIVVKPLDSVLKGTKGFAGTTLLGDGKPALILDVASLV